MPTPHGFRDVRANRLGGTDELKPDRGALEPLPPANPRIQKFGDKDGRPIGLELREGMTHAHRRPIRNNSRPQGLRPKARGLIQLLACKQLYLPRKQLTRASATA